MPYADAIADIAVVHDADAHIMEPPTWLKDFADPVDRDRMPMVWNTSVYDENMHLLDRAASRHNDPSFRADDQSQIMLRKNWEGTGSFISVDRPAALDLMGFATQLIFNTFCSDLFSRTEQTKNDDSIYAMATAHNRAITEFCSPDPRLLPVGFVSLADIDMAIANARHAIDIGCAALMISSACPRTHSPSHIGLDPVWAMAQAAGIPIVFHVGGGGRLLSPTYFNNGLPAVPDFHGGAENFRSVDYMAIPTPVMQTLATMIFDGVLDRFPTLKFGVIEQGASWLPGWMRNLDAAFSAFRKNETRLHNLSTTPSEIVRRQIRVTPYPHEDTGWCIANSGPEICMFSSDFPHVEGGRNPLKRFEESLAGVDPYSRQRFYRHNFADIFSNVLSARGLPC